MTTRTPTLGVLADWLEGEYQSEVVGGVVEAARERGANVISFVGGVLGSPYRFGAQRNLAYQLATASDIDGLIVLAGTLGNYRGLDELAAFCDRFRPLPMVSLAAALPGMSSILIEGEQALRDGVRHLIEEHRYRRFAFIGGPEGNAEAQGRLRVSMEVLTEAGLWPADSQIATGDFQYDSGVEAVRLLLDERSVSFDAVIVANDQMALGVIDGLRAHGKRVPRDVALLGFDDIRDARYSAPPLTTVRQPLHELGRVAVETLFRRMGGEPVEDVLHLATELIVRRSCGCNSGTRRIHSTEAAQQPVTESDPDVGVDEALRRCRERILDAVRQPAEGLLRGIDDGWAEALLDALIVDLRGLARGRFADRVDLFLEQSASAGGTGNAWQPTIGALRRAILPCLASDPEMRSRAEDLLQEARGIVGDAVEHTRAQRRLVFERRARVLEQASEAISASLDLASLGDTLDEWLPKVGIPSGYIVLYGRSAAGVVETGTATVGPDSRAARRLVYAYDHGRRSRTFADGGTFAPGALLPEGTLPTDRHDALVVAPLFFKDDPIGYVVFEFGPLDSLIYERMREQISGVLMVALLIDELKATGAERARLLADLEVRAAELEDAYKALQDNQDRLVSTEKMASLGRITANIAHEMNTPLAAVRTALVEIEKRAVEYQASSGDVEVTAEDHAQIAAEMLASLRLARSAAERAARFVRGVKTQTRDISGQERVPFDPMPVIEDAILLLSYDLRRASCQLDVHPPQRPIQLLGSPGLLSQVITNLVTNALDAMPAGGGTITVTLSETEGAARLVVQDTGSGIPPGLRDKVFEPMFTTKPFGRGTGLGLAIVHDLVTGQLGGTLELDSELGIGTTFTITFPASKAS